MKRIKAWKIVCMALIPVVLLLIGTVVFRGFSAKEEEAIKIGVVIYRGTMPSSHLWQWLWKNRRSWWGKRLGKKSF